MFVTIWLPVETGLAAILPQSGRQIKHLFHLFIARNHDSISRRTGVEPRQPIPPSFRLPAKKKSYRIPCVKIDRNTTQEELLLLRRRVTQKRFLRSTPLNAPMFLRYTLLFLLFPGMMFGFKVGMFATLLFSCSLLGMLLADATHAALCCTSVWFSLGACIIVYITAREIQHARRERRLARLYRPAEKEKKTAVLHPEQVELKWKNNGNFKTATLYLRVPERGIYAMLLTIENYAGGRIIAEGKVGVCIVPTDEKAQGLRHALILYSLEAGCHTLSWRADKKLGATTLTQLNSAGEEAQR